MNYQTLDFARDSPKQHVNFPRTYNDKGKEYSNGKTSVYEQQPLSDTKRPNKTPILSRGKKKGKEDYFLRGNYEMNMLSMKIQEKREKTSKSASIFKTYRANYNTNPIENRLEEHNSDLGKPNFALNSVDEDSLRKEELHFRHSLNEFSGKKKNINFRRLPDNFNDLKSKSDSPFLYEETTKLHEKNVLKEKLKEALAEIKKKDEILEKLKKEYKFTKFQETEIQLKVFAEETLRLRRLLNEAMKIDFSIMGEETPSLSEKLLETMIEAEKLRRACLELQDMNGNNLMKMTKMESKLKELEDYKLRSEREKFLKQMLKNYEPKTDDREKKIPERKSHGEKTMRRPTYMPINNNEQIAELKEEMEIKEKKMDEKLMKIQNEMQEKLENETNQKYLAQKKFEKEKKEHVELKKKYKELIKNSGTEGNHIFEEHEDDESKVRFSSNHIPLSPSEKNIKKRFPKVNLFDVEKLGLRLKFGLQISKIEFEDLLTSIFPEKIKSKQEVSIKEMANILEKEPFSLSDKEESVLLSRYLIEDNLEDYIFLNEEMSQSLNIVGTILRKLIGKYKIYTGEEDMDMYNSISRVIKKSKTNLEEFLRSTSNKLHLPEGKTTKDALLEAFKFVDAGFNSDQTDYILMRIYSYTFNIELFDINYLFYEFDGKEINQIDKSSLYLEHKQSTPLLRENRERISSTEEKSKVAKEEFFVTKKLRAYSDGDTASKILEKKKRESPKKEIVEIADNEDQENDDIV